MSPCPTDSSKWRSGILLRGLYVLVIFPWSLEGFTTPRCELTGLLTLMDHWQSHFVNRPLTRSLFLSVRWARLAELWASYSVRQALSRYRFLRLIEVDFDRIDLEQRLRYQARVDAALPMPPSQLQRPPPMMWNVGLPLGGQAQGLWV